MCDGSEGRSWLEAGLVKAIGWTASGELGTPLGPLERIFQGVERALGWSDASTPPARFRLWVGPFADPRTYRSNAVDTLKRIVARAGLKPLSSVLDVGCGCGLLADPLTKFLDGTAKYEGFDIEPHVIDWCRSQITSRHPLF